MIAATLMERGTSEATPAILVFSSLFPSRSQPNAGVFIRERMFRVGRQLPVTVVAPQPWFPLQGLLRYWRPHFRPGAPPYENQQGVDVYHPRFFCVPAFAKQLDGLFMALGTYLLVRHLKREKQLQLIDAHFAYPDGYAATLLGRWLKLPVTITLRGTEVPHSHNHRLRPNLIHALASASRIFSVSESLRQLAVALGIEPGKIRVVANGVDIDRFYPMNRLEARRKLGIAKDAKVLVSVGALVERKGFHRVIEVLPDLIETNPDLHYVIVGGASAEGDRQTELKRQVKTLGLENRVHFLGVLPPTELKWPLSAADFFVLATSNEGWANVFLEAMACGLPVIATDVGGNAEVVCRPELGTIVPFGDSAALRDALQDALSRTWDRKLIRAYAVENAWDSRIAALIEEFTVLTRADTQVKIDMETGLK